MGPTVNLRGVDTAWQGTLFFIEQFLKFSCVLRLAGTIVPHRIKDLRNSMAKFSWPQSLLELGIPAQASPPWECCLLTPKWVASAGTVILKGLLCMGPLCRSFRGKEKRETFSGKFHCFTVQEAFRLCFPPGTKGSHEKCCYLCGHILCNYNLISLEHTHLNSQGLRFR